MFRFAIALELAVLVGMSPVVTAKAREYHVAETRDEIRIETTELKATVRKTGYVSGVSGQSFVDRKTGFRDAGFGLDIVDWIMEPGSDEAYRDQLAPELVYPVGNLYHGRRAKRCIEGPQICTQAKTLAPRVIRGDDFVAIEQQFQYRIAAPARKVGSMWTQRIAFPQGKRYFISMDQVTTVNDSEAMFMRIDMPGHIKHTRGDSFKQIYLSYFGLVPAAEFFKDFAPDERFNYRRDQNPVPERFIRAYQLRDHRTGRPGPWLAGMTLDPAVVYEAWCHERGYVCMIEEFGGRPIRAGKSFSAAFIVGFFDDIDEMNRVYDQYKGATQLDVSTRGWKLGQNEVCLEWHCRIQGKELRQSGQVNRDDAKAMLGSGHSKIAKRTLCGVGARD